MTIATLASRSCHLTSIALFLLPMSEVETPQLKKRKMSPENDKSDLAPVAGLLIKRHSEKARLPTRGSALAAGYDLYRFVSLASFGSSELTVIQC